VGRPCGTHEGQENALRILVDKNEWKRRIPRR
jgi:hypothetical protein